METKPNILQRINAVMGEVDYIQKERKNGMQYTIVSHDAVTALLRPHIQKQGIVYYPLTVNRTQDGNRTEMDVVVRFCNMDDREDYIDVQVSGYGIDTQDKGTGKAMSYAVKYALLKTFGLETGDDPDNDQNVKHEPAAPRSYSQNAQQSPDKAPDGENDVTITKVEPFTSKAGAKFYRVYTDMGVAAANGIDFEGIEDLVQEQVTLKINKGFINEVNGMNAQNFGTKKPAGQVDISDIPF